MMKVQKLVTLEEVSALATMVQCFSSWALLGSSEDHKSNLVAAMTSLDFFLLPEP